MLSPHPPPPNLCYFDIKPSDFDENFMDDFEAFEYEPELLIDKSSSPQIIQHPSQPFWSYITINWFVNQTCLSCSSLEIEHVIVIFYLSILLFVIFKSLDFLENF